MKYLIKLFSISFLILLMSSCSEHIPSKEEQAYINTADSLKHYQNITYLQKQLISNEKARDLMELDYEEFKEKHHWNDEEMDVFYDIIKGHLSIAKMLDSFNTRMD